MSEQPVHEDWGDDDSVSAQQPADGSQAEWPVGDYTAPSITDDPLTRLWRDADDGHGRAVAEVARLRERKRVEAEARPPRRHWLRHG